MSAPGEIEYTRVRELRGPLMVVEGVSGVGWDEFATIVLDSGERRHGLVLEMDRDLAVVQVLQDTAGMDPGGTRIAFSGTPLRIPVGTGWLGRVCNGRGEPADGGPPVLGRVDAPVGGAPINPVRRQPPTEAVLTGVGAIDHPRPGTEASRVLRRRAAPPPAGRPGGRPGDLRRRGVRRRLRRHGTHACRRGLRPRRPGRTLRGPGTRAADRHRGRPGDRAAAHTTARAHGRRTPRLRQGPPRPGGDDGHDGLFGGTARGVRRTR